MDAYEVASWDGFAVAMLGAAAVLVGLIFVALSVNMQAVLRYPWLVSRAAEAIILLVAVLVACTVMLVPGQSAAVLGTELAILGGGVAILVGYRSLGRRASIAPEYRHQSDTQAAFGVVALLLFVPAGLSLIAGVGGGLYWLVPATLLCVGVAMLNAWVLLVEINR